MFRACDFCHQTENETSWWVFKSPVTKQLLKVCLCDICADNEKKYLSGKLKEGDIRCKPELSGQRTI